MCFFLELVAMVRSCVFSPSVMMMVDWLIHVNWTTDSVRVFRHVSIVDDCCCPTIGVWYHNDGWSSRMMNLADVGWASGPAVAHVALVHFTCEINY